MPKKHIKSKMSTLQCVILCAVVSVIVIAIAYLILKKYGSSSREHFPITSGMITPQRRFYGKCIDNCWRNFTGDSSEGQFNWLCTDACERKLQIE